MVLNGSVIITNTLPCVLTLIIALSYISLINLVLLREISFFSKTQHITSLEALLYAFSISMKPYEDLYKCFYIFLSDI